MTVADSASFADESAKTGGLDIQRVCVINASRLTVRVTVDDYRHTFSEDEASLWVDTHPRRPGPEFFMGAASMSATGRSFAPEGGASSDVGH